MIMEKPADLVVNGTEDPLTPDAEDNEGEDEVGGEALGTGRLIHIQFILPYSDV
jgi:hypothetical protein